MCAMVIAGPFLRLYLPPPVYGVTHELFPSVPVVHDHQSMPVMHPRIADPQALKPGVIDQPSGRELHTAVGRMPGISGRARHISSETTGF